MKSFKEFVNEKFDYTKQKKSIVKNMQELKPGDMVYHCGYEGGITKIISSKIDDISFSKAFVSTDKIILKLKNDNNNNEIRIYYIFNRPLYGCVKEYINPSGKKYSKNCIISTDYDLLDEFVKEFKHDLENTRGTIDYIIDDFLQSKK